MRGLKRRKARQGVVAESVKALEIETLRDLYIHNATVEGISRFQRLPSTTGGFRPWGGYRKRIMMSLIYAISFNCFLRIDETLRIEARHIRLLDSKKGKIELVLDYRKTAQAGDIKPFVFWFNRSEPWLDVSTLLVEWLHITQIRSGYLFRGFNATDNPKLDKNVALTSGQFLTDFRLNLQDISQEPMLYGGHSFRRGGVQYFYRFKRWNLVRICDWGGWSSNYSNTTIMRYLLGLNDHSYEQREDFLNPNRQLALRCGSCGRDCPCGARLR